ncbi:MAG: SDR family oxidoreductase, partial [Verrucomicrobiota bacterium]
CSIGSLRACSRNKSFSWGPSWDEIEKSAARDLVPNDIERLGRPEEIAGAVEYLCSPFADYISGAVIRVDGGMVRAAI